VGCNAVFAAWLTINVLGATWAEAYSRAQQGRHQAVIRFGWITAALCWPLQFIVHRVVYRLMLKDVRHFVRDARQWTQMAIMFGLLLTYVVNLHRLPVDIGSANQKSLMAFLNLATVSLILATFTSRFVFPLLSLESQQLWLLGLLPVRRVTILLVKFLFAATVTAVSACGVVWLAAAQLALPRDWALMNLLACLSVCLGLSGLAIGLGARFPSLGERNPARIAAGFGGTVNLIASMVFVVLEVYGVAMISLGEFRSTSTMMIPEVLSNESWVQLVAVAGLGPTVAFVALFVGARHFARLEW
jgi:ABC-2 type transport system permease protein